MARQVKLTQILDALDASDSLEGLQQATLDLRDLYGLDHVVYHWVDSAGEQYGCGTYSDDWVQRYLDQGYLRIDPVIQGCYQRFHPVDWKRLDWTSKAAREFRRESIDYGVAGQGYSVPVRGPNGQFALFTVSRDCDDVTWKDFTDAHACDLILVAHYFNRKALEFEPGRTPEAAPALSPRERDAMTMLAMGYSRAQVADTLEISEHTLRVYIESARFKLGASNTTHAVARALSRGMIVV